jgi:uncharacterized protein
MNKSVLLFITIVSIGIIIFLLLLNRLSSNKITSPFSPQVNTNNQNEEPEYSMSIEALKKRAYPESDIIIEETLSPGANYQQYIASYKSDGLKIYGLLTVPTSTKPEKGFPTIVFLHGYIPPKSYSTTQNYPLYQAVLARNGFITFKPDLRGHGNSEGNASGAHFSEAYVVDTLNNIAALKKYKDVDPNRIGVWGHSNGGEIGLRSMVVSSEIKAGVFWAGVVGSFEDMLETYNAKIPFMRDTPELVTKYGSPSANPTFWNKLDPYSYLKDISGPIQLHHGTADDSVPVELSIRLKEELEKVNKPVELYQYAGDDHNISTNFTPAWQRTIEFFKKHL